MNISRFLEAVSGFDDYLDKRSIERAEKYAQDKTDLEILTDAKEGKRNALVYIYHQGKKIITHVFWKYFMGPNKRFAQKRILSGDDKLFAAEAFLLLAGNSDIVVGNGPLGTFNPEIYKPHDQIKKFNYYFERYLMRMAFSIISERKRRGMTGQGAAEKVSISSYDTYGDNIEPEGNHANDHLEMEDAIKDFISKLKGKRKEVMSLRMKGKDYQEIADIMGYSNLRTVERIVKDLGKDFKAEYGLA